MITSLWDYSVAYIFVKGTIIVPNTAAAGAAVNNMYDLIEYSNAYLKPSARLWQYYRDEPAIETNVNIIDFPC